jgi:hypothetical protein
MPEMRYGVHHHAGRARRAFIAVSVRGQAKLTIRVFRDVDEADRWLTAEVKTAGS